MRCAMPPLPTCAVLFLAAALPLAARAQGADLSHEFETSPTEHGFYFLQSKDHDLGGDGRVSLVPRGRQGGHAVRLTTRVGDSRVHGSDHWERTDLATSPDEVGGKAGRRWWWANSILLPGDFHMPQRGEEGYVLMDWHDDCSGRRVRVASGQANFHLDIAMVDGRPVMRVRAYGGDPRDPRGEEQRAIIDPLPRRELWYDFVHEVHWAADASALYRLWMRTGDAPSYRLVFERINRPNMYAGCDVYLKLANYHGPYGVPSSVLHDRVLRGRRAADVAMAPLEGRRGTPLQ